MHVTRTVQELRAALAASRGPSFVPTMGNLHEGHLSLVRSATTGGSPVVASIFVNPLQFAPTDDFDSYPRTLDRDCELLEGAGCDILFAPSVQEMYPEPQSFFVKPSPDLADMLEGEFRPGFFVGVCTVVMKLFSVVSPRRAYFGKKDYQQWLIVRRMVEQFRLPIELIAGETVREADGLAMSSRNARLSAAEREAAPQLHQALLRVARASTGAGTDWRALETQARDWLSRLPGWRPEYIAVRRRSDLGLPGATDALVVLGAARLGTTRLIDNIEL